MTTPTDDLFDPRVAEWLEQDPTSAPGELLEDVLRAASMIDQRGPGTARHSRAARWAALPIEIAAVLAVALVGGVLLVNRPAVEIAGPSTPPGPTPQVNPSEAVVRPASSSPLPSSPPPSTPLASAAPDLAIVPTLTKRFSSPTYGYSIGIRPDWATRPAKLPWSGPDNSPPVVDEIDFTGTDSGMTVASQALSAGQTLDDWLVPFAANGGGLSAFCQGGDPSSWPPVQVGDAIGRWQQMCNAAEVVVESGGRVYVFTWGSGSFDQSKHLSPDDFKAVLTTVRFEPSTVPPSPTAPPLPRSFTSPRMGYSIQLPDGWSITPATASWAPRTQVLYTDHTVDVFQSKTARLAITSQPLTAGQTADDWMLLYCQLYQPGWVNCPTILPTWPAVTVGDATGRIDMDGIAATDTIVDGGRVVRRDRRQGRSGLCDHPRRSRGPGDVRGAPHVDDADPRHRGRRRPRPPPDIGRVRAPLPGSKSECASRTSTTRHRGI